MTMTARETMRTTITIISYSFISLVLPQAVSAEPLRRALARGAVAQALDLLSEAVLLLDCDPLEHRQPLLEQPHLLDQVTDLHAVDLALRHTGTLETCPHDPGDRRDQDDQHHHFERIVDHSKFSLPVRRSVLLSVGRRA